MRTRILYKLFELSYGSEGIVFIFYNYGGSSRTSCYNCYLSSNSNYDYGNDVSARCIKSEYDLRYNSILDNVVKELDGVKIKSICNLFMHLGDKFIYTSISDKYIHSKMSLYLSRYLARYINSW